MIGKWSVGEIGKEMTVRDKVDRISRRYDKIKSIIMHMSGKWDMLS